MLRLLFAWNFCGALLTLPLTWLHQEVLIAQAVVTLIILAVSCILQCVMSLARMFAEGSTALLFALSARIEVSVLTVLSFFIPGGWNALRGKKKCKKRRLKHFRGHSWSDLPICLFILHWVWYWMSVFISRFRGDSWSCSETQHPKEKRVKSSKRITSRKQSFVLSAVFIAGRRRVFGRNLRSQIKKRGFITLQGYDVCSSGFPVSSLLRKKRKTKQFGKDKSEVHEVSHVQFHEQSCPRMCGGANSQQDTDLLSNLQALLSHSRTDPDKPQSDDQVLLQSLKSLETQAQNKKNRF